MPTAVMLCLANSKKLGGRCPLPPELAGVIEN